MSGLKCTKWIAFHKTSMRGVAETSAVPAISMPVSAKVKAGGARIVAERVARVALFVGILLVPGSFAGIAEAKATGFRLNVIRPCHLAIGLGFLIRVNYANHQ